MSQDFSPNLDHWTHNQFWVRQYAVVYALGYPNYLWKMASNTQQQNTLGVLAGDESKEQFEDLVEFMIEKGFG